MSNSKELERLWRLQTKVNMLVSDGKRSASVVADALQAILDQSPPKFELYLFGKQNIGAWEMGYEIEKHLKKTGLINSCLRKDDDVVKSWITKPETYPEEFKGKSIYLWKSAEGRGSDRRVPCLFWRGDRVLLSWHPTHIVWDSGDPAVLVK